MKLYLDDVSESDTNITYFLSGFIGRSITLRRKHGACKNQLLNAAKIFDFPESASQEQAELFEMADRGGLSAPSELCFSITKLAVQSYNATSFDDQIKMKFFSMNNQQLIFVSVVTRFVEQSEIFSSSIRLNCANGHANFHLMMQCAFNCFAKNELKRVLERISRKKCLVLHANSKKLVLAKAEVIDSIFVVFPCYYRVFLVNS